jgi:hypothetical protein
VSNLNDHRDGSVKGGLKPKKNRPLGETRDLYAIKKKLKGLHVKQLKCKIKIQVYLRTNM